LKPLISHSQAFEFSFQLSSGEAAGLITFSFFSLLPDPPVDDVFAGAKSTADFGVVETQFGDQANSLLLELLSGLSPGFYSIHGTPYFRIDHS